MKNRRRKTLTRNLGETLVLLLPDHQFCVIIVGKRVIYPGSAEEKGEIKEGEEMADMGADMVKSMAVMQEVLKKLVPEAVFP